MASRLRISIRAARAAQPRLNKRSQRKPARLIRSMKRWALLRSRYITAMATTNHTTKTTAENSDPNTDKLMGKAPGQDKDCQSTGIDRECEIRTAQNLHNF